MIIWLSRVKGDHVHEQHRTAVLNTYRHLRLAMIVIVVVLGTAVLLQRFEAGCWQTSISAYYFTAVHGVFIAALCAIGACLIVYKGSSDTEDTVLNLSGFLAFVVAMVPIAPEGICGGPSLTAEYDVSPGVGNNVAAVLVTGVIAGVVRLVLAYKANPERPLSRPAMVSLAVGWIVLAAGAAVFVFNRRQFEAEGHKVAAVLMFAGIVLVILINAWSAQKRHNAKVFVQLYGAVASVMGLALVVIVAIRSVVPGWQHVIIYVEVVLIAAFAVFWGIQTTELWGVVDRDELPARTADRTEK